MAGNEVHVGAAAHAPQQDELMKEEEEEELLRSMPLELLEAAMSEHRIMAAESFAQSIVFATNHGTVVRMEYEGHARRVFQPHRDPVSDVSMDQTEAVLASCDKTGLLILQHTSTGEELWRKHFSEGSVESVALHPDYASTRADCQSVVCCTKTKMYVLSQSSIFGHRRCTLADQVADAGRFMKVRWRGAFVASLSTSGITLYAAATQVVVRKIGLPTMAEVPVLLASPPSLLWEDDASLCCAWGNWINVVHISSEVAEDLFTPTKSGKGGSPPCVLADKWQHVLPYTHGAHSGVEEGMAPDHRLCGLAPFGPSHWLMLWCSATSSTCEDVCVHVVHRTTWRTSFTRSIAAPSFLQPLQLRLLPRTSSSTVFSTKRSAACLSGHADASHMCQDVDDDGDDDDALIDLPPPECEYVVLAGEVATLVAPCTLLEHVQYLRSAGCVKEAYRLVEEHAINLPPHLLASVEQELLLWWAGRDAWEEVMAHLSAHPLHDEMAWQQWLCVLDEHDQSWRLAEVLPCCSQAKGASVQCPPLSPTIHDVVLLRALQHNMTVFCKSLRLLHAHCSLDRITAAVEVRYRQQQLVPDAELRGLSDAFAFLLHRQHREEEAMVVLFRTRGEEEILAHIRQHSLWEIALHHLPALCEVSVQATVELCLEGLEEDGYNNNNNNNMMMAVEQQASRQKVLAPHAVVHRLRNTDRTSLWTYLVALRTRHRELFLNEAALIPELVLDLNALYAPSDVKVLLDELMDQSASMDVAPLLARCRFHGLVEEAAYLLGAMRRPVEGLMLIVHHRRSMRAALHFIITTAAKTEAQRELFRHLVALAQHFTCDDAQAPCVDALTELFEAVADPLFRHHAGIDVSALIEVLDPVKHLSGPHARASLLSVLRSRSEEVELLAEVVEAGMSDVAQIHGEVLQRRSKALRIVPCNKIINASSCGDRKEMNEVMPVLDCSACGHHHGWSDGMVSFRRCAHRFHPRCYTYYANACADADGVVGGVFALPGNVMDFRRHGNFIGRGSHQPSTTWMPCCPLCGDGTQR